MEVQITVPTLGELLAGSAASEDFKSAVREFAQHQKKSGAIHFAAGNPPVKVLRAIMGLLEAEPGSALQSVEVTAVSGCSDYRGNVIVNNGEARYAFVWDCAWKAREMGWNDYFGEPDQIKAARTFGYRCFESYQRVS